MCRLISSLQLPFVLAIPVSVFAAVAGHALEPALSTFDLCFVLLASPGYFCLSRTIRPCDTPNARFPVPCLL